MDVNIAKEDLIKLKKLQDIAMELLEEFVRLCNQFGLVYYIGYGTLLGAIRHKGFIPWDDDIDVLMPRSDFEKFTVLAPKHIGSEFVFQYYNTDNNYLDASAKIRKLNTRYATEEQKHFNYISHGCWIDIFALDNFNFNNKLECFIQKYINMKFVNRCARHRMLKRTKDLSFRTRFITYCTKVVSPKTWFNIRNSLCKLNKDNTSPYLAHFCTPGFIKKSFFYYKREWFGMPQQVEFEGRLYNAPQNYEEVLNFCYKDYMELPPFEKRTFRHPPEDFVI